MLWIQQRKKLNLISEKFNLEWETCNYVDVVFVAPSVADVQAAIEYIFPLVYEFRKERTKEEAEALARKKMKQYGEAVIHDEEGDDAMSELESWDQRRNTVRVLYVKN